jgi:hypothetical protein
MSQMPLQREFLRGGLTLILIVALAAGLRLYGLEIQSLCNDELSSWTRSLGISLIGAIAGAKDEPHPPLHHIVIWLILNYAGDDALYLRLPSAIFGILAVYRVYFLARDAYGHRAGLFAAATLAVSYTALYFSQEARVYSLVALLTVLSTHAALHWAQALSHGQRPPVRVVVRLCLWSILLIYAHYFGILTVAAQALVLFILCFTRAPSRLGSLILGYLVIAVSYLPWLPAMMFQLGLGPGWIKKPGSSPPCTPSSLTISTIEDRTRSNFAKRWTGWCTRRVRKRIRRWHFVRGTRNISLTTRHAPTGGAASIQGFAAWPIWIGAGCSRMTHRTSYGSSGGISSPTRSCSPSCRNGFSLRRMADMSGRGYII